jgi:hypothetical protein
MKITSINFVLENLECLYVRWDEVVEMNLCYSAKADHLQIPESRGDAYLNRFDIEIDSKADVQYVSFGEKSKSTVFERLLKWDDITSIVFEYDKGAVNVTALVPWEDAIPEGVSKENLTSELFDNNIYQTSEILPNGNLRVRIGEPNDAV